MRRRCPNLIYIIAIASLMSLTTFGQVSSSISGAVLDPNGEVVSGATVVVKNAATGAEFRAISSGSGGYTVPSLGSGTYLVTVSATGFKQAVVRDVKLDAGVPATVNVTLEVGAASESVVVQGGGEVLQTQSATVATTLVANQVLHLPLVSRNALDFIVLLPGANTPTTARASSINGLPDHALNITIDGINTQDNFNKSGDGFFSMITPRLDAIEEMTVSTATPGAESSGQGAVQVKFVTRRGSNELHGSLYEYHRNSALNSNYWFNNRDLRPGLNDNPATFKAPRDRILLNQYGFRVGGPVVIPKLFNGRDKVFFFGNYEEYRLPTQISRQRTIFSPEAQQGLFRYGTRQVDLLDLARRNGHTATIDPVVGKLLADIRNSTTGTGSIQQLADPNLQRYTFTNSSNDARYFTTIRLDFNMTENHQLESTYYYEDPLREKDILNSTDPAFPDFPNFGSVVSNRFSGSLALRSTLSSTMVNEARFGFQGGVVLFNPDTTIGQFTGPLANQAGFHLDLATAAGISSATRTTAHTRRSAPLWHFGDTLNRTRGAHTLSFGGSFTQINVWLFSQTAAPEIDFGVNTNDPANALFTTANFPGAAAADLNRARGIYSTLTGRVISITANAQLNEKSGQYAYLGERVQRGRQRELGFFAQDAWRARPNLTLNYGLRWELQRPFTPLNDSYTTTTIADLFGVSGAGNLFKPGVLTGRETQFAQYRKGDHAYNVDYKNLGPTFGFAWSVGAKDGWLKRLVGKGGQTVLRGGYSIAYTRPGIDEFSSEFGANPGSFVTASRSLNLGNLVGGSLGALPVLLRETNRLGPAPFPNSPSYPLTGAITNGANVFDPNLKTPYVQSWTFGVQREIAKNMAVEVRYVGNRSLRGWTEYNLNEINIVENSFLNEFRLAQANLRANIAAGRGATFAYTGVPGTSPLPIIAGYFNGLSGAAVNDPARYTSTQFTSTTFINTLALNNPNPCCSTAAANPSFVFSLYNDAGRRANALAANLPVNLFLVNPGLQGGSSFTGNGGYSRYDGLVFELNRRLTNGLLVQSSYAFAKSFSSQRVSLRAPRINSPGGTLRQAFKTNWVYELPIGRGQMLFGNAGRMLDRLASGWEFHGASRIQSGQVLDFGNVNLVGMTRKDLQQAFKLRFDHAGGVIYSLPQDIIDNTIKAWNVSATLPTGYSDRGAPTGRYIAPANGASCIQVVTGDCAGQNVNVYGPRFARFDLSVVKKTRISERVNFELRGEFLNAFNHANFFASTNLTNFTSDTFGQVTSAYRDSSNTQDPGGRLVQIVARFNF
ncbi:MAG: carboxypeptidase-like regulatory domain-containing protein [Acidobacteria bacterium]|nr:carboxypeptidase-like regulatory domain-containing protein [Acidobacteriota bacterium]